MRTSVVIACLVLLGVVTKATENTDEGNIDIKDTDNDLDNSGTRSLLLDTLKRVLSEKSCCPCSGRGSDVGSHNTNSISGNKGDWNFGSRSNELKRTWHSICCPCSGRGGDKGSHNTNSMNNNEGNWNFRRSSVSDDINDVPSNEIRYGTDSGIEDGISSDIGSQNDKFKRTYICCPCSGRGSDVGSHNTGSINGNKGNWNFKRTYVLSNCCPCGGRDGDRGSHNTNSINNNEGNWNFGTREINYEPSERSCCPCGGRGGDTGSHNTNSMSGNKGNWNFGRKRRSSRSVMDTGNDNLNSNFENEINELKRTYRHRPCCSCGGRGGDKGSHNQNSMNSNEGNWNFNK